MNTPYIVVDLDLLKLDKSIEVNLEHPLNNALIFTRDEVSIFPKITFSKLEQELNNPCIVSTLEASKLDKSTSIKLLK